MKKYLLLFLAIFLIVGIFASYNLGNPDNSIKGFYSQGNNIQGWINLSLNNESGNSLFEDSRGNSISLINLLKTNSSHIYSCNPSDCNSFYSANNPQPTKVMNMNLNETKLIGLRFNENLSSVNKNRFF